MGKSAVSTLEINVSICTCTYVVFMQFKKTTDSSLMLEQMIELGTLPIYFKGKEGQNLEQCAYVPFMMFMEGNE